jgi:hypothetical protein
MLTRVFDKTAALDYSLMTVPHPLCVSPATGPPAVATLTFVVSAPRSAGAVPVQRLVFTLPVGGDPTDLTEDASAITASVSSSGTERWQAGGGAVAGAFVVRPSTGGSVEIATQALTISFQNVPVSRLVGTARVKIVEDQGTPDGQGTLSIEVPKFPPGFYALDFTAAVPEVASGQTVTLKWQASANAHCQIRRSGGDPVDVSAVRTWTSPPLYSTTVFLLHASATEGGQTVGLDLTTAVIVAVPVVVSFDAVPSLVDYNESVVVTWRSEHSDGVELLHGQSGRETLPPVSDPKAPKKLVLRLGDAYTLQAFKGQGAGRVGSLPYSLLFTFNPIRITFTADPEIVDIDRPTSTLKWDVGQAKEVRIDDKVVDRRGQMTVSPKTPTTYHLKAIGENNDSLEKSITVKPAKVEIVGVEASLQGEMVVAIFEVKNAVFAHGNARAMWQLKHTPRGADMEPEYTSMYPVQSGRSTRWECRQQLQGRSRGGISLMSVDLDWEFQGMDSSDRAKGAQRLL